MLQLVKQNHATVENSLSSVRDKTVTFLDNHFFSNPKQFAFWTHIETINALSEADTILDRWSSDGTEYAIYMANRGNQPFPINALYKKQGLIYLDSSSTYPEWALQTQEEKGRWKSSASQVEFRTANGNVYTKYFESRKI
jgi:two-component system sensor histidine kinase YesM